MGNKRNSTFSRYTKIIVYICKMKRGRMLRVKLLK